MLATGCCYVCLGGAMFWMVECCVYVIGMRGVGD